MFERNDLILKVRREAISDSEGNVYAELENYRRELLIQVPRAACEELPALRGIYDDQA
jgi:hypothetical protein